MSAENRTLRVIGNGNFRIWDDNTELFSIILTNTSLLCDNMMIRYIQGTSEMMHRRMSWLSFSHVL